MNITFDPLSPGVLAFHLLWLVIGGALMAAAMRSTSEWVKATLAAFGLSLIALFLLAILPSWWLYFADARLGWRGNGCVAINFLAKGTPHADAISCYKQALKDIIVVIENAVVVGALTVGFMIYQRKFPRQLATGEAKPEATGGYK